MWQQFSRGLRGRPGLSIARGARYMAVAIFFKKHWFGLDVPHGT